ncbi:SURF1 family protein [Comamonas endophytica]|uniref:SURF1-like protein n=1 Tax=Comamonas endophytica TaxID=2949090 RepID=A0ABY6GDT8_9BURK|nr:MULTISPECIES: SURF1 family protein [unclassified Acidovorax]MCD2511962.1 SURF1 family protein [Acidovorax sp. D4N7]UYG53210.1 SURF1 family protein [Acidovorax sp. 5MLIR]UYG53357.1 SURF1 family protein [Acidovorax sp. 5MLIR]
MLALLGMALFFAFVGLGTWQLQRRAWKLDLIERVTERVRAQPVAAPAPAQWPEVTAQQHEYLPVTLTGRLLTQKTVLAQAVTELGAGFWVMTPLQAADGSQTLVNRGFVPASEREAWLPAAAAETAAAPQSITGLLRMSEPGGGFLRDNDAAQQRWYSRDVAAIAAAQGLERAAPYFIDAGRPGQPVAAQTWPRPGMTVIAFHNSHLVYALTWYGMALMVLAAAVIVVRWEKRRALPAHKTL